MDRDIVIVVPTETAAYEGLRALRQLDEEGSIELYAARVIAKDADGNVRLLDEETPFVGAGTLVGMSTGALIGLLAGPVGVAAGLAMGGAAGLTGDVAYSGFSGEFVTDAGRRITPGSCAIVIHAFEDWTVPIDTAATRVGGAVFREAVADVALAQLRSRMQALKDEAAHFEQEIAKANGKARAELEASRRNLDTKRQETRARIEKRVAEMQQEIDAEIAAVKEKVARSKAHAKERHEQHVDKLAAFKEAQKKAFHDLLQ